MIILENKNVIVLIWFITLFIKEFVKFVKWKDEKLVNYWKDFGQGFGGFGFKVWGIADEDCESQLTWSDWMSK